MSRNPAEITSRLHEAPVIPAPWIHSTSRRSTTPGSTTWLVGCAPWAAPPADIEDLAQEVFLVVRRRQPDFDGRNIAGWLYRIASRQVRQHRRRHWLRTVFSRQGIDVDDLPSPASDALAALNLKEKKLLLELVLGRMSEKRRVVFSLFEVEGYRGEEIADILDVPLNTVWTRLYHARKDFFAQMARQRSIGTGERRCDP